MIYTLEEIAAELAKNKTALRHWIIWDDETHEPGQRMLPAPFKVIGDSRKIRLYDETGLQGFKEFDKYLKENPGVMAEYNKKHFWKK